MYFIAIACHAEVNEKVLLFKSWMKEQFGCVVALRSPAHITLVPPFWLEEMKEIELQQALQSFSLNMDDVEIILQGFSHFSNRVLFINVKENPALEKIKQQTEKHFVELSGGLIKTDNRSFHAHVTIANRDLNPPDFIKAWGHFSNKEFKETFRTRTISLLKLSPDKWNIIGERKW